jgi:uncharacterized protein
LAIFALADLHLGFAADKPMDIFGAQWKDHPGKIERNWRAAVGPDDTVLLPGDLSWGMTYDAAEPDLKWIHELPGKKIVIRGNHDYWWSKITRLRGLLPPSIIPLQYECMVAENYVIAGTRGWTLPVPGLSEDIEADGKVYERERLRLDASLAKAPRGLPIIAMMHFPPFIKDVDHRGFSDILEQFGVAVCVYGHFHGPDAAKAFTGVRNGVRYVFCAADGVDFTPVRIAD